VRIEVFLNLFSQNNYSNLKNCQGTPGCPIRKRFFNFKLQANFNALQEVKKSEKITVLYIGTSFKISLKIFISVHKLVARESLVNQFGTALEFVNSYKYLGFTFQPSGKTFTKHVADRCRLGQLAMLSITKLPLISISTAINLFDIKISPIVTYGNQVIWPYLSVSDLRQLEKVKKG
jgi:hypothetical protein